MPKLTKTVIDNSLPQEKHYIVWDTEIKGFGCQILKSGVKKTYVFYYLSPITRRKGYIKIGCHGNITVDFARNRAKKLSADVASRIDPKIAQKAQEVQLQITEKQTVLFVDFFKDFEEKYIRTQYKDGGMQNLNFSNLHILPFFGKKKLEEISAKDIRAFVQSLAHIPISANRCVALLSVAFKKAVEWEYLSPQNNPCAGIQKYKENKKQRFLSIAELKRLEDSLMSQETKSRCLVNAIRLILYTGCRRGEILNLKWENVHLDKRYIYLPDSKTGEGARPLNQKAIDLLRAMEPKEGNPYVFYGIVPRQPITINSKAWQKILKCANIRGFRIHDLRHSFASFCLAQGVDLYTVSKLLGHRDIATTTRYAHLDLEHLKKATNKGAEVFG